MISVFSKKSWKKYKTYFDKLSTIIRQNDRSILDEEIPFQLAKEVCQLSKLKFYLYFKITPQRLTTYQQADESPFEEVSTLDILLRFGGSCIEETMERTMSEVMRRYLDNNIEVLGAFDLPHIGMLAFLRTENGKLKDNKIISSLDSLRKWKVIKEPFMFVDPYAAYIKHEHQKEQGIRQYLIEPVAGAGKPIDTEILKLEIMK